MDIFILLFLKKAREIMAQFLHKAMQSSQTVLILCLFLCLALVLFCVIMDHCQWLLLGWRSAVVLVWYADENNMGGNNWNYLLKQTKQWIILLTGLKTRSSVLWVKCTDMNVLFLIFLITVSCDWVWSIISNSINDSQTEAVGRLETNKRRVKMIPQTVHYNHHHGLQRHFLLPLWLTTVL